MSRSRAPLVPPGAVGGDDALRLIVNARIATGDARRPWADALLADGTRVLAIGRSAELQKLAKGRNVEVIDARGAEVGRDGSPLLAAP